MNLFCEEHIDYLKILQKHQIEFILIGGAAVNFYGYSRPTGDLDIWLNPNDENKGKLISALREIKIFEDDINLIEKSDFSKPTVFHIGNNPPFIIDFLTKIVGVTWNEAWPMRKEAEVDGLILSFLHINHLKANKLIAGRPRDLDDLYKLARIEELRQKDE